MLSLKLQDVFVAINMTNEDWAVSQSAPTMLAGLYLQNPDHFKSFVPILHKYLLACCWKRKSFIPQKALRDGLRGATKWIEREITDKEFWKLERDAETEAFMFENIETAEEISALKNLISGVDELQEASYETSVEILKMAAYFTDSAMVYPSLSSVPYDESLFTSKMLCPHLLREFLQPRFHNKPREGSLDLVANNSRANSEI